MPEQVAGKRLLGEIHLITLAFMMALVGVRLLYITLCATPISCNLFSVIGAVVFLTIGAYFSFFRFNATVATLFNSLGLVQLAFMGAMAAAALVFYTGRGFPLVDAQLAAIDHALGFDWPAYVAWFDRHPWIDAAGQAVYLMIFAQSSLIIILLIFTEQAQRVYVFISVMMVALLIVCVTAVFLPALGPYQFFGMTAADHPHITLVTAAKMTAPIEWLRSADFSIPMPEITVGLISFPSYHAATAAIYIWAAWRTPYFKWGLLAVNCVMLLSTPVQGSHYLIDVVAGVAVAIASIAVTQSAVAAFIRRRSSQPNAGSALPWLAGLPIRVTSSSRQSDA